MTDRDRQTADTIFRLLAARRAGATICPSEVARAMDPAQWQPLMPAVRDVARALAAAGRLEIRQGGVRVEPSAELRGPIRLALPAT